MQVGVRDCQRSEQREGEGEQRELEGGEESQKIYRRGQMEEATLKHLTLHMIVHDMRCNGDQEICVHADA